MIKDKDRTPVAKDVACMCTKCKMELNHIVIAHNKNGIVERVKCHTCGSEHKYRVAKKTPEKTTVRKKTSSKKIDPKRDFEMLSERFADKTPVQYNMSASFNMEDVISHSVFGKGIVTGTSSQKMEVMFADGLRVLAMDRK